MATSAHNAAAGHAPWVQEALALPNGAHFSRCALQVNPFEYVQRNSKATTFSSEADYNLAIVEAAQEAAIDAIAVTDHYRIKSGAGLIAAAESAGISVFPGFEAVTKEGVHFLCFFEIGTDLERVDRAIGECGISYASELSPLGKHDVGELLELAADWGGLCVAAHIASAGGLLRQLSGQSRAAAWTDERLLAAAVPGPTWTPPKDLRAILDNSDPTYRRRNPVAQIAAKDVSAPAEFQSDGHSTWIKMSEPSLAGLRQAFLDPESRVCLDTELDPEPRTEIRAIRWDGGFLDGCVLHLNDDLNVLVGPPGAGKSTVVESVRYVLGLDSVGDDSQLSHQGIIQKVVRNGTRVSVLLHSHRPSPNDYLIERTVPNPPSVRQASTGKILDVRPSELVPQMQVFGQHEISEVARSPDKRTRLLERFVAADKRRGSRQASVRRDLAESRSQLLRARGEINGARERLAALPGLEETLRRFREAGVEERLRERSLLVREERTISTASERVTALESLQRDLIAELPIDRAFLSAKALADLPGRDTLAGLDAALETLTSDLEAVSTSFDDALSRAGNGIQAVRDRWEQRRQEVEAEYASILRELQKSQVDGSEFIELRHQIEELRPLREQVAALEETVKALRQKRQELLLEWEDLKAEQFRDLEKAAKRVSGQLRPRVRVTVAAATEREALFAFLRERVGGRLRETFDVLQQRAGLSLTELADAWRAGPGELSKRFSIPQPQAQRMTDADPEVVIELEELELSPTTEVELNVAREGDAEQWRRLEDLSTGQKATAILLLLLLESDAPLVVDQPEDDLDNRFIFEGVVPRMREEKRRRQFLFSTHNANIPVLGDAELIVGLSADGEAGDDGHAHVLAGESGSIDMASVRGLVEELLEGGHEAFELRRLKYGF